MHERERRISILAGLFVGIWGIFLLSAPAVAQTAARVSVLPPTHTMGDAKRLALVIGNAAYRQVPVLKNPVNDARAVAERLRDIGYEVYLALDVARGAMNDAIDGFLKRIEPGSETLVYYAGHGVEVQGSNYLLPIDITPMSVDQERRLRSDAVNLTDLLTDFQEHKARITLVILDACRDNPFQVVQAAGTRSLGSARGLTRVEPPRGTFVMFSAGVGQTALDNLGPDDHDPNGLFTRKLLGVINEEGLELHSMVLRLRKEVQVAALAVNHEQFLGYYDQLTGEFFFHPPSTQPTQPLVTTPVPAPAPEPRPAPEAAPAPAATIDAAEIARSLETELRRVGCYSGPVDGKWRQPASEALRRFSQHSGVNLDVRAASLDAIEAVRGRKGRVCPVPRQERPATPVAQRELTRMPPAMPVQTTAPPTPARGPAPTTATGCFTFNNQRVCP